ncbi:MAG TPA: hypothetical protein VIU11_00370 [Nakamurella sp.]
MTTALVTLDELDGQQIELLPARQTMALINVNVAPVIGVNMAFAINAATINSSASAAANQVLTSVQF